MPIVTIQITRERNAPEATDLTPDVKASLISGATKLLQDVLNKPANSTFVIVTEVESENWGWGGLPIAEYRKLNSG
jgi:4-oxalocrotonate tautomerase